MHCFANLIRSGLVVTADFVFHQHELVEQAVQPINGVTNLRTEPTWGDFLHGFLLSQKSDRPTVARTPGDVGEEYVSQGESSGYGVPPT